MQVLLITLYLLLVNTPQQQESMLNSNQNFNSIKKPRYHDVIINNNKIHFTKHKQQEITTLNLLKVARYHKYYTVQNQLLSQKLMTTKKMKCIQYNIVNMFVVIITFIISILILYGLIIKSDNSYSKKLLDHEQKLGKMRKKLIENIVHEIRTSLSIINGTLEKTSKANHCNNTQSLLENAIQNAQKIDMDIISIIHTMESSQFSFSITLQTVHAQTFLTNILKQFKVIAEHNQLELLNKSQIPPGIHIRLDVDKTQKIISNFITNALKHTPYGSRVILNAYTHKRFMYISISNFGKSIPNPEQKKILNRFYKNKENHFEGLGIDLSLAKELAVFLGGDITLESYPNQPTTFTFKIPIIFVDHEQLFLSMHNTYSHKNERKAINSKPQILIVDNTIDMIAFYKKLLQPFYQCHFAVNAIEGIKLAKKYHFDLVISDIMMPKIDGFQFRKLLKELPNYIIIPFIYISAINREEYKIKALQLGIDDYITKPFHIDELLARIQNTIQVSKDRKQFLLSKHKEKFELRPEQTDPFVTKVLNVIQQNIDNENFSVKDLAEKMYYSQSQLARILTKTTGLTPVKFILEQRLKHAYLLLQNTVNARVSNVQHKVGINNASYFQKKFKERFGINPSELIK